MMKNFMEDGRALFEGFEDLEKVLHEKYTKGPFNFGLYSIFDAAAQLYGPVMYFKTVAEAARAFKIEAQRPESMINSAPQDYWLDHLGGFDPKTGELLPNLRPFRILTASSVIAPSGGQAAA